jgi:hypothetical protein
MAKAGLYINEQSFCSQSFVFYAKIAESEISKASSLHSSPSDESAKLFACYFGETETTLAAG